MAATFPSINNLSQKIVTDLKSGRFVIVQLPLLSNRSKWETMVAECVVRDFYGDNDFIPIDLMPDESNAIEKIKEILDYDAESLESALENFDDDEPLVLSLVVTDKGSGDWGSAFFKLSRALQKTAQQYDTRPILLFLTGELSSSEIMKEAAVSLYRFWNVLNWEELRIYSMELLMQVDANPLYRSWQIATYTGVANGDPFLLELICQSEPSNIDELISIVNNNVTCRENSNVSIDMSFPRLDEYWKVPLGLVDSWLQGLILGVSIERGGHLPWEAISQDNQVSYAKKLIWREQISGLFPVLMEMSNHSVKWVTQSQGEVWKRYLSDTEKEVDYNVIEPSVVLDIFRENRTLGKLPKTLLDLLHNLRIVRNKLAHIEAIDSKDIKGLWDKYLLASGSFGDSRTSLYT